MVWTWGHRDSTPCACGPALHGQHGRIPTSLVHDRHQHRQLSHIPAIVGETGGKDFILAQAPTLRRSLSRLARRLEYRLSAQPLAEFTSARCGEPCRTMRRDDQTVKMGNVTDFSNFLGPVIDERAFNRHLGYLDIAASQGEVLTVARRTEARDGLSSPRSFDSMTGC